MNAIDHLKRVLEAAQDHAMRVPEGIYNEARQFLDTLSKNEYRLLLDPAILLGQPVPCPDELHEKLIKDGFVLGWHEATDVAQDAAPVDDKSEARPLAVDGDVDWNAVSVATHEARPKRRRKGE